jgi:hypothetical protein
MSMVSKVKDAGNSDDIPKLQAGDYLRKETQNEKAAAMIIVGVILKQFKMTMKDVQVELSVRDDENWDGPGEPVDLTFLKDLRRHKGI